MTQYYTVMKSPIGSLLLTANDDGLTGLYTEEHKLFQKARSGRETATPFTLAQLQLQEYFAGLRTVFDVKLAPDGTDFQQRVWQALRGIGYGKTMSYGAIANDLQKPTASRAVGMANGRNPISIIVPCHRVIGASGKLTGYAGGLKTKEWLLAHETKHA